jgi:hypothetical protein
MKTWRCSTSVASVLRNTSLACCSRASPIQEHVPPGPHRQVPGRLDVARGVVIGVEAGRELEGLRV